MTPVDKIDRGYVRALPRMSVERQTEALMASGCRKRDIYGDGQGIADFDALVRAARVHQIIGTAGGFRVFGDSRKTIMAAVRALDDRGAVILDVETGERSDHKGAQMLDRALARIHGEAAIKSAGNAAEIGRAGGKEAARRRRERRMPADKARKLWFDKSISTAMAIERMGPGWSKGTCIREFGPSGRPKGAFDPKRK